MSASQVFYITGTSSGFGRELALILSQRGHKVIATARTISKIEDLGKVDNIKIQQLDVTDSFDTLQKKVEEAISFFGTVDVLVNNAGYSQTGCFEELTDGEIRKQYDTNVFGTVNLTRVFLPYFRSTEKESIICTITSAGGLVSFPTSAAYTSTKFALEGFFEGLDGELKASNLPIRVLIIEPGGYKTNFIGNIIKSENQIDVYNPIKEQIHQLFTEYDTTTGGNALIGSKLIADALLKQGFAAGKDIPLRLPIGSDCINWSVEKFKKTVDIFEEWRPFAAESDPKN
ncbi:NAD(P)-binding protein [Wallemia mellicola]|nr:NAD(P)-binding protein [Wallemia mellicola]